MNHTEHYGLNLYEESDYIHHDSFNADNQRIDAALSALPKMQVGSYQGSGTYGAGNPNTLHFDFVPKLLYISRYTRSSGFPVSTASGVLGTGSYYALLPYAALTDNSEAQGGSFLTANGSNSYACPCTVSDGGKTLTWYNTDSEAKQLNSASSTYYYIAIG